MPVGTSLFSNYRIFFIIMTYFILMGPSSAIKADAFDFAELEKKLKSEGLVGWVHGAAPAQDLYVLSYRSPDNFFVSLEFSLIGLSNSVKELMTSLKRHDRVRIKGFFGEQATAQKHIWVNDIEIVEPWTGHIDSPPQTQPIQLPEDLENQPYLIGIIHASLEGGRILVLEYQNAIIPVRVSNPNFTSHLYRGDKVKLYFKIAQWPQKPTHLILDESQSQPLELLDSIKAHHGQYETREGFLVLFPKSPQIKFDVYALQTVDEDGTRLNYTLVNLEDLEIFEKIREKLATLWAQYPDSIKDGRNKLVNEGIRIRASGMIHVISPNQANPQILLDSADDVIHVIEP